MNEWQVWCNDDDGVKRVLATSRIFDTKKAALAYANTVAPSRYPDVHPVEEVADEH